MEIHWILNALQLSSLIPASYNKCHKDQSNKSGARKQIKCKQFIRWEIKGLKNTQGQSVMRGPEVPLQTLIPFTFPSFSLFRRAHMAGGVA